MSAPVIAEPFRQSVNIYRGSLFVNQRLCFTGNLNNSTQVASPQSEFFYATSLDTDGVTLKIDITSKAYNLTDGD